MQAAAVPMRAGRDGGLNVGAVPADAADVRPLGGARPPTSGEEPDRAPGRPGLHSAARRPAHARGRGGDRLPARGGPGGEAAQVYLRGGGVYAVVAPGKRPELGDRLVTSGALAPEALGEALEAQRTELQGWRLGELLVHLSYVDQAVVEDFVHEQIRATLSDLLGWQHASWKFRVNQRTRDDVVPPVPVEVLLHELSVRQADMAAMRQVLHGPDAVPSLSAADTASGETEIDADAWSLLCKVDGTRSVADLARDCGFTMYEAGLVVVALVQAGLLEVEEPEHVLEPEEVEPEPALTDPRQIAASLAAAFEGFGVPDQRDRAWREDAAPSPATPPAHATASDDIFSAPVHRPTLAQLHRQADERKRVERDQRAAARRDADAGRARRRPGRARGGQGSQPGPVRGAARRGPRGRGGRPGRGARSVRGGGRAARRAGRELEAAEARLAEEARLTEKHG
jgi:hypothetical protein